MEEKKQSFWVSLPGILTGLAALISAIVGLYIALQPNRQIPPNDQEKFRQNQDTTKQITDIPGPTPESLSKTEYSLPGDAIFHFRVIEVQGRNLTIEVDYRCNSQHGQKVMAGAWLKGVPSGYNPAFVSSHPEGTTQLQLSVNEAGTSEDIEIFLYEWGRPSEPFAKRTFPYQMHFD